MAETRRVVGCPCPCHTRPVSEEERAGALRVLRNAGVPIEMALETLGYVVTPELREELRQMRRAQEKKDA